MILFLFFCPWYYSSWKQPKIGWPLTLTHIIVSHTCEQVLFNTLTYAWQLGDLVYFGNKNPNKSEAYMKKDVTYLLDFQAARLGFS